MRLHVRLYTAVVAIAAIAILTFGAGAANAHGGGKRVLKLVAVESQFEFLDLGAPGPSLGDEFVFSETLFRHGRDVGMSGVVCTLTHIGVPYEVQTFHCVGTLSLRRGQITLQGLIEVQGEDDPGPFIVAITGGTGAFRGAGGEAVVRELGEGESIYKLRFDSRIKHRSNRHKHHGDRGRSHQTT